MFYDNYSTRVCGSQVIPALTYDAGLTDLLFAEDRTTAVHSVFPSIVNIICEHMVVGIHSHKSYIPGCIQLEYDRFACFRAHTNGLKSGDRVRIRSGLVCLDQACSDGEAGRTGIDVRKAEAVKRAAAALSDRIPQLRKNLLHLAAAAAVNRSGGADFWILLGSLVKWYVFGQRINDYYPAPSFYSGLNCIDRMIGACRTEDEAALLDAACGLVGLGIGLTPTGDDILTGFIAAAGCFSLGWISDNFTQNLLSVAELNTNAVSYTYMRLAAQGNISDMLQNAIISAAASDMPTMLENFNRLSDWGATSGIDIAFGAVLGLSAAAGL